MELNIKNFLDNFHDCHETGKGSNEWAVPGPVEADGELPFLNRLVDDIYSNEGLEYVLEIGSWLGASTIALGLGIKNNSLYDENKNKFYSIDPLESQICIDTDPGFKTWFERNRGFDPYPVFLKNIEKWGIGGIVNQIKKLSCDLTDEDLNKFRGKISLLWIDSSHEYQNTIDELYKYVPLVKSGGYIVMHDRNHIDVFNAVKYFLQNYLNDFNFRLTDETSKISDLLEDQEAERRKRATQVMFAFKKVDKVLI